VFAFGGPRARRWRSQSLEATRVDRRFGWRHHSAVVDVGAKLSGAAKTSFMKKCEAELAFYDFPAEHWKHLRTTNVIESSFATVRHRTVRSKGWATSMPSLSSSPWILGAPHSGFSKLILWIRSRTSLLIRGRPPGERDFHRQ